MGDIATVAATTPTDLLPNLAQAVPAAVETAAPAVAQQITVDYLNLPMPTDYVFDVNGKTVYAMTPDHIDIEQGETFVQFADDMGGDDLPGGVPNAVDIGPYLDPVESISQRDVDKAVARAIQDTLINEGDEFFLGDVRRYYDEAGNNAGPATPFDIQRIEAQNDPEGIFEEVMGNFPSAYFGPGERFPDQYQFDPDPDSIQSPPGFTRVAVPSPRVQKRPILRDPTELEDSDWDSPFEAQIARDAEKLAEQERIEELARDREVTEAIPRLPVLDRKLSEARDRLKSLEAGNPPPGFEDDYTQEEIEEDIRIEKNNIATLEKESSIKQEEPIEAESKEVKEEDNTVLRMKRPEKSDLINSNEDLRKRLRELFYEEGVAINDLYETIKPEVQPSHKLRPNNITYRGAKGQQGLRKEIYQIAKEEGFKASPQYNRNRRQQQAYTGLINSNEDLQKRVVELFEQGYRADALYEKIKPEVQPSSYAYPNNIDYTEFTPGAKNSGLYTTVYSIIKDLGLNEGAKGVKLPPLMHKGKKIPLDHKSMKEAKRLGREAALKKDLGETLTEQEEDAIAIHELIKGRERALFERYRASKKAKQKKENRKPLGKNWWVGANQLPADEQRALAKEAASRNYSQFKNRSRVKQYETVDGKERIATGAEDAGNLFLGKGNKEEERKILALFEKASLKTIQNQELYAVDHILPIGNPRIVDGEFKGGYVHELARGSEAQGVGLSTSANLRVIKAKDNSKKRNFISRQEIDELIAEDAKRAKKGTVTKSLNLNVIDSDRVPNPDLLGPISFEDNNTGRVVRITGFKWLDGVDYDKVLNNVELGGRAHKVPGNKKASVNMSFVYVPYDDNTTIYQSFEKEAKGSLGISTDAKDTGVYQVAINLASFSKEVVDGVIQDDARRANISEKALKRKIKNRGITDLEYAIQSTINHEFTHVNHFAWEREVLGGSSHRWNNRIISRRRSLLYKHLRSDILKFIRSEGKDAFQIFQLDEIIGAENNREALIGLDLLFKETSKPISLAQHQTMASKAMFVMLTEMAAYQASPKVNNIESWFTKLKTAIKNILKKAGVKFEQNNIDDFIDNINSNNEIDESLLVTRIMKGEKVALDPKKQSVQDKIDEVLGDVDAPGEDVIYPNKFDEVLEIAEKNKVSKAVIEEFKKGTSLVVSEIPVDEMLNIIHDSSELVYDFNEFKERIEDETDIDTYVEIVGIVNALDFWNNVDYEAYEYPPYVHEEAHVGDTMYDLGQRLDKILGIGGDKNVWLRARTRPIDPDKNYNEQFEDVMNSQVGNTETPGYTSPLNQELDRSDDAAQREYTDSDSVSRPKARERTMLRNLFQHLYSRAAQTVRRHSGASKTTGLIADMILRAPHVKQREKETKAGRDYVQKKSMAMGEFRLEAQRALDELTNRGGVIPRKVNDQLRDYFLNGTMPQNGRVAAAVSQLESAIERIYTWSEKVGTKYTEDFSLRPIDGGKLPRVYDTDKVASPEGRRKLMDLLNGIGIVNDPSNDKYDATDVYNIILNSGGFVSGDFTENARNTGVDGMQTQRELFEKIESEIPREQLGDLLLTDYQAIIPRFVDKAIEKTVYAETFGHKNEHLLELKQKVREEIEAHNRKSDTFIETDYVMKSIDEMMDIIHHRYKVNTIPTRGRKVIQAAMNATTMAGLTLVSLASMPEFFTMTALGSKNPAKFATNVMGAATYSALKGLNGMNKLLTGRVMKGYFDPKTKVGKRAKFLRELGLYDISSLGEAAAQRYVGPSFIKAGVGSTGNSFAIRALYRLYGLGNLEKGRFRARQGRALMNMDTYFEINMLTTMTQMQQMMALKNLEQNIVSDAKALSKAAKGKGMKLDSTIAQIKSNLKGYGLSDSEINELVKWYDAGHRELYDVPGEFKLDLAGPAHRFVQAVITLPSEGSLPKVFRNPAFAPFLLFKSFITTFGNTFVNTVAQRLRFAEGTGVSKKYQQGKQLAGMMGTAAAMYGAVQFAQAVGYLIKYGEDDDPWEEKIGDFNKFMQDFERTGLLGPLGSLIVQTATPNYWSWAGKDPYDDLMDYVVGPVGRQASNVLKTGYAAATGGDVDPEGRLAKAVPLTKSTPLRKALGADPYYTKDKKGGMIRRRTLERREEKKAAKAAEKKQTILDSIPNEASKVLGLSKTYIVRMSKKELDQHIKKKTGIDVDGRKSKIKMLEEMMKKKK